MKKAFVTGGTGFVGSAVVRELLQQGDEVKCLVRSGSDRRNLEGLDVELAEGDILDRDSIKRALENCDRMYHVAALYTLGDPEIWYWRANVLGTINVLSAAMDRGLERVVHTSTVGAVGSAPEGGLANEDTPWDFGDLGIPYVTTKYIAESEAFRFFGKGLPVVVVNPAGPIGPRDIKPTPTGLMIVQFLRGTLKATPQATNNFIDVDDLARGHRLAMEKGTPGHRYILGAHNTTLMDLFKIASELTGVPKPLATIPYPISLTAGWLAESFGTKLFKIRQPLSAGGVRFLKKALHFDTSKAVNELGFSARPLEESVKRAVEWFYEHGYAKRRKTK